MTGWGPLARRAARIRRWVRTDRPVCTRCFHELRADEPHECQHAEARDEQRLARAWLRRRSRTRGYRADPLPMLMRDSRTH